MKWVVGLVWSALLAADISAQTLEFSSGDKQVQLLELYSSQGCSSCPPAERWISQYRQHSELFSEVIPVVFHVDYWDYLGWKDPFSQAEFSQRQRQFKRQGLSRSVYTPGFFVNGQEWRGWFRRQLPPNDKTAASPLAVRMDKRRLSAAFVPAQQDLTLHVAILGFGLQTPVSRGENRHKTLQEDFVVLTHQRFVAQNANQWDVIWPRPEPSKTENAEEFAVALWVTKADQMLPLQATGQWLPQQWFNKG